MTDFFISFRKLIIGVVCMGIAQLSLAQSPATQLETALNARGAIVKYEVFSLDNLPAFRMDAMKVTNVETFAIAQGVKVLKKVSEGKKTKTVYTYIDRTEIEGLLTSLAYIKTIVKSNIIPGNFTAVQYATVDGFQVTLQTGLNPTTGKLEWRFSVQTKISEDKTFVQLEMADIDKLQKLLQQAKSK